MGVVRVPEISVFAWRGPPKGEHPCTGTAQTLVDEGGEGGGGGERGTGLHVSGGTKKLRGVPITSGEKEYMSCNWGATRSLSPGFPTKLRSFARAAG